MAPYSAVQSKVQQRSAVRSKVEQRSAVRTRARVSMCEGWEGHAGQSILNALRHPCHLYYGMCGAAGGPLSIRTENAMHASVHNMRQCVACTGRRKQLQSSPEKPLDQCCVEGVWKSPEKYI
jgi:hypothetical protein